MNEIEWAGEYQQVFTMKLEIYAVTYIHDRYLMVDVRLHHQLAKVAHPR